MNEFWAFFCFISFALCVVYVLAYLYDERKGIKQSLKQTREDLAVHRMRKDLMAAEDSFNYADTDHVEAAIYDLQAVMSKTNTDIRAEKSPEDRKTEYAAMKWLMESEKPKHKIKLFYASNQ